MSEKSITLYYSDLHTGGSSDKVYVVELAEEGSGYVVNYQYGRRGSTLKAGTKVAAPLSLAEATRVYDKTVAKQLKEGYRPNAGEPIAAQSMPTNLGARTSFPPELLKAIDDEDQAETFLRSDAYAMEVKYDGERRQIEKLEDGSITSYNKLGQAKPLSGIVAKEMAKLSFDRFHLDGELIGDIYIVFDIFVLNDFAAARLTRDERRALLIKNFKPSATLLIAESWETEKIKRTALEALREARFEGVVFKRKDAPYKAGRNGQHKKFKFLKMATCKVVGTRHKGHNSATLALRKGYEWVEVGRASLIGKDRRIKIGSYVEVKFQNYTGSRLYQPRIHAFRDDVKDADCSFAQLKKAYKQGVNAA